MSHQRSDPPTREELLRDEARVRQLQERVARLEEAEKSVVGRGDNEASKVEKTGKVVKKDSDGTREKKRPAGQASSISSNSSTSDSDSDSELSSDEEAKGSERKRNAAKPGAKAKGKSMDAGAGPSMAQQFEPESWKPKPRKR